VFDIPLASSAKHFAPAERMRCEEQNNDVASAVEMRRFHETLAKKFHSKFPAKISRLANIDVLRETFR